MFICFKYGLMSFGLRGDFWLCCGCARGITAAWGIGGRRLRLPRCMPAATSSLRWGMSAAVTGAVVWLVL
jgi:hypothetical protein